MAETTPLKTLVISSSPLVGIAANKLLPIQILDVEEEKRRLREAFNKAKSPIHCRFIPHATNDEIHMALSDEYDIIHFTGHGSEDGHFLLENEHGRAHLINATEVVKLLRNYKAKLVFISACYSQQVAEELKQNDYSNIVCVDARFPIHDSAAILFAQIFYHNLAKGKSPSLAFQRAKEAVAGDEFVGDEKPVIDKDSGKEITWSSLFKHHIQDDSPLVTPTEEAGYKEVEEGPIPNNLPQMPYFTGRELLIYRSNVALDKWRLVTLAGPPGIGKTRLGLKVAHWHRERRHFSDGIYLVKVEDVTSAEALPVEIARAMGLELSPGQKPVDSLTGFLKDKEALIVLDNFETLLTDETANQAAGVLRSILEGTEGVRILATSREKVGIKNWEKEVPVKEMEPYDAIQLFVHQARSVSDKIVSKDDPTVKKICEMLDYHPLSLYLAASQLEDPTLTLEGLHTALDKHMLDVLRDETARDVTKRQKSLRVSLDLSYDRLSPEAKTLFAHLSVFKGGASEQSLDDLEGNDWKNAAKELVRKNLAYYQNDFYHQLMPIREYAHEKFKGNEKESYLHKFSEYFLIMAWHFSAVLNHETLKQHVINELGKGAKQDAIEKRMMQLMQSAIIGIDLEKSNIVSGADWAYINKKWDMVIDYAKAADRPFDRRGHWSECIKLLGRGVEAATAIGEKMVADKAGMLNNLGALFGKQGNYTDAKKCFEERLRIARAIADKAGIENSLHHLGNLLYLQGDYPGARKYYEESIEIEEEIGNRAGIAGALHQLGILCQVQGDYTSANEYYEESLKIFKALGDKAGIATSLHQLGTLSYMQRDYKGARKYHKDSMKIAEAMGDKAHIASSLGQLGKLEEKEGRLENAVILWLAAFNICNELNSPDIKIARADLARASKKLGEKRFNALVQEFEKKQGRI